MLLNPLFNSKCCTVPKKEFRTCKKKQRENELKAINEFHSNMTMLSFYSSSLSDEEKITFFDYFLKVIKNDICADYKMRIFEHYTSKSIPLDQISFTLPTRVLNEFGEEVTSCSNNVKSIDLSNDYVLVEPWSMDKLKDVLRLLKHRMFQYDDSNHMAYYFTQIDLCYVYNGKHSISAGTYYSKGNIDAKIILTENLYPHLYTDGYSWFNSHTKERYPTKTADYRIAMLYEISKNKYNLINKAVV